MEKNVIKKNYYKVSAKRGHEIENGESVRRIDWEIVIAKFTDIEKRGTWKSAGWVRFSLSVQLN
jgi:hypothetical protein